MKSNQQLKEETLSEEELQEAIEHRDALMSIRAVLDTDPGREFIKYLFKHLEVSELPPLGMREPMLNDKLGFLRAGNAIFKIVSEANSDVAALILAQIEREKQDGNRREHTEQSRQSDEPAGRSESEFADGLYD